MRALQWVQRKQKHRGVDWDDVREEYEGYISSYVDHSPFHLFDRKRQRNISRSELKQDISAALRLWIKAPLTCSDVMDTISSALPGYGVEGSAEDSTRIREEIRRCVSTAMMKNPPINGESRFISQLEDELKTYNRNRQYLWRTPRVPIRAICRALRRLMNVKRTQTSISSHHVHEQISQFGQYAILSHRWCPDGQELSFGDAPNLSDPSVRVAHRQGLEKFMQFSEVVKAHYGCRYLWMDSLCIHDTDRDASIPLMFDWYRRAYICVIREADGWEHRGWTLQEFLAARRIRYSSPQFVKFGAPRGLCLPRHSKFPAHTSVLDSTEYRAGPDHALPLFHLMCARKTTRPEDMAYCLISALNIDIPVHYGEGFDRAFYRLQVECLSRTHDRRLLLWDSNAGTNMSSPHNSMLAAHMRAFDRRMMRITVLQRDNSGYDPPEVLPDPSISFDEDGVMRIMMSLHPCPPHRPRDKYMKHNVVFASLGTRSTERRRHVGVLLRPVPSPNLPKVSPTFPDKSLTSEDSSNTNKNHLFCRLFGDLSGQGKELGGKEGQWIEDRVVVYERVECQEYPTESISSDDLKNPKWVYIR